jgi:hypothetical protein
MKNIGAILVHYAESVPSRYQQSLPVGPPEGADRRAKAELDAIFYRGT